MATLLHHMKQPPRNGGTCTATQARNDFATICEKVARYGDRYVITRHSKPVMAFVPLRILPFLDKIDKAVLGCEVISICCTVVETRENFARLGKRIEEENLRVIITKQGDPYIAMVPIGSEEAYRLLQHLMNSLDASEGLQDARENGTRSLEEFRDSIGI